MRSQRIGKLGSAAYTQWGYGQVEINHLTSQRTGQIYAQLPANPDIDVLENGQFAKYDMANFEVNFSGPGEWLLVYNEIKLYHEGQFDCEFALKKSDYNPRIYSPLDPATLNYNAQTRYYGGTDDQGNPIEKVTAADDWYEIDYNENPFHIESYTSAKKMPAGTTMIPRLYKTSVGDIITTNTIDEQTLTLGQTLTVDPTTGFLKDAGQATDFIWQVAKVYTMPDGQPGVKIVRIA